MQLPSKTHVLLIPSYNSGSIVLKVVEDCLAVWQPVWIVLDGSTDGTQMMLETYAKKHSGLRVFSHNKNRGKGSAIFTGIQVAAKHGFSHILAMDADGQHPVASIQTFMQASISQPDKLILGEPVFDEDAPALRVNGRKISNFWANLETLWAGIHDSLFGFRVYPLSPLIEVMNQTRFARRFDFDPEVVVRLVWLGLPVRNITVPVRYLSAEEGGVSQFKYIRDNVLLTWMHFRLFFGFLLKFPQMLLQKVKKNEE